MKQEQKELLIKDLCGRLPYEVKVEYNSCAGEVLSIDRYNEELTIRICPGYCPDVKLENVKPFLFPLSSMTEEQKEEYYYIVNYISSDDTDNWQEGEFIYVDRMTNLLHFYHRNHIDYRGLIPKGLAIDATGLNVY